MYSEVEFLLHQELRETPVYNSVIEAVAMGNTKLNDISKKSLVEDTSKTSVYLKNLIELGIVEREFISQKQKKNELPFRYTKMGRWFGKTTVRDTKKENGLRTAETEIDVLCTDRIGEKYLVGECKFKGVPFSYSEYLDTLAKLTPLKEKAKFYYALFSESGFFFYVCFMIRLQAPMMQEIMTLREKYDLHMKAERMCQKRCRTRMIHLSANNQEEMSNKDIRSPMTCPLFTET